MKHEHEQLAKIIDLILLSLRENHRITQRRIVTEFNKERGGRLDAPRLTRIKSNNDASPNDVTLQKEIITFLLKKHGHLFSPEKIQTENTFYRELIALNDSDNRNQLVYLLYYYSSFKEVEARGYFVFDTEKESVEIYHYKVGTFVKTEGNYQKQGGVIYLLINQKDNVPTYYCLNVGLDSLVSRTYILGTQSGVNHDRQLICGEFMLEKQPDIYSTEEKIKKKTRVPEFIQYHLKEKRMAVKNRVITNPNELNSYKICESLSKVAGKYKGYYISQRQEIKIGEMYLEIQTCGKANFTDIGNRPHQGRVTKCDESDLIVIQFNEPDLILTLYFHEETISGTYGGLGTENIPASGRIKFRKLSNAESEALHPRSYRTTETVLDLFTEEQEMDLLNFFTGKRNDAYGDDAHIVLRELIERLQEEEHFNRRKDLFSKWEGTYEEFFIDPTQNQQYKGKIIKNIIRIESNGEAMYEPLRGGHYRGRVTSVNENHLLKIGFDYEEIHQSYRFELLLDSTFMEENTNGKRALEGIFFGRRRENNRPIAGKVYLNKVVNDVHISPNSYDFNSLHFESLTNEYPRLMSFFLGEEKRNFIPNYSFFREVGVLPKSASKPEDILAVAGDYLSFRLGNKGIIEVNPVRITKNGKVYFSSSNSVAYNSVAEVYLEGTMLAVTTYEKDKKVYFAQSLFPLPDSEEELPFLYGLSLNHSKSQHIRCGREVWIKSPVEYEKIISEKIRIPFNKEEDKAFKKFYEYDELYYGVMTYLAGEENNIRVNIHQLPDKLINSQEQALAWFYGALYMANNGDKQRAIEWKKKAIESGINFHDTYRKKLEDAIKSGIFDVD